MRKRKNGVRSSSWIRPEKRWGIYDRDGFICVWCGQKPDQLTLDHLFHRGSRHRDNDARRLVTSCVSCNTSRKAVSVSATLRSIRDQGFDLDATLRRLRVARWVPVNRKAGKRAMDRHQAAERASLAALQGEVLW